MEGWIKLHRKLIKNWIWSNPLYTRAWVYCLFRANFQETKVPMDGEIMLVHRGEFITSIGNFAKDTGMSVQQVKTFWKLLENDRMLVRNSTNKLTKLTICNYDDYQDEQQSDQQTSNKPATTEKNIKKEKNKEDSLSAILSSGKKSNKDKLISPEMFDSFWKMYPRKINKGYAFDCWTKLCNKTQKAGRPTWGEVRKAIMLQSKTERWQETDFIPHPSTWLNQFRWLDDPKTMNSFQKKETTKKTRKGGVRTPDGFYDDVKVKKIEL